MKRLLALGACLSILVPAVASAQGAFYYFGAHPINPAAGGGFCPTAGSHVHPYDVDPNISYLYRNYNSHYYFTGNVYEFGYQGQAFPYYGHHPLSDAVGHYCYLDGSHYHATLPMSTFGSSFVVHNGFYYYNGAFPAAYYTYRPSFYRTAFSYRYLPTYRTYYTSYNTYYRTYARPASIGYIYNPPRTYVYRTGPVVRSTVTTTYGRPGYARTVTTAAPAYRYNPYRPSNYGSYYNRPAVTRTTTTYTRPVGTTAVTRSTTTTTRTWRR